jgi:hypothetical protein
MTTHTKRRGASESVTSPAVGLAAVVVPVDLTPSSDRVLGRVALLPLADGARVTLLHVVPGSLTGRERQSAERDAYRALASEVRHLRERVSKKVRIESLVQTGSVAGRIGTCATELQAELGDKLSGPKLIPFAFSAGLPKRISFDQAVLGYSPKEAARYWIDRKIRGQSGPPQTIDSAEVVMKVVANLPGSIGYVRVSDLEPYVKTLLIDGKAIAEQGYPVEA